MASPDVGSGGVTSPFRPTAPGPTFPCPTAFDPSDPDPTGSDAIAFQPFPNPARRVRWSHAGRVTRGRSVLVPLCPPRLESASLKTAAADVSPELSVEMSTTQVSLLPPPCEEFTISDPARRATRVSPPWVT